MSELNMSIEANEVNPGVNGADAVPQKTIPTKTKADEFSDLIEGEFKEEFGKRVGETIRQRLKGRDLAEKTLKTLEPMLNELYKNFEIEEGNEEELVKAYRTELQKRQNLLEKRLSGVSDEYDEIKKIYPDFNSSAELENEDFVRLLKDNGLKPREAFELLHRDEIIKKAKQNAEDSIIKKIKARGIRPHENGSRGSGGILQNRGVASLSVSDREEIDKRVAKGEIIVL